MNAQTIRKAYLDFFQTRHHAVIDRAPIVLADDPTTLFTGSGMQPIIPYLLGEEHPAGVRLADSQTCLRAQDIDDIGDNRHTTFFEMLGNWSLGDLDSNDQSPYYIRSNDPNVVQAAYESIWYVRLYTEDPSNPNNLTSRFTDELYWWGEDENENGKNDSLGGHIINAVPMTLSFTDSSRNSLQSSQTITGKRDDGTALSGYFVKNGPTMPDIADTAAPTSAEQADITEAFSRYYYLGSTQSFVAPDIPGYSIITPFSPHSITLSSTENTLNFVYSNPAPVESVTNAVSGTLAATGMSV